MVIEFSKYQGLGNDFILIDNRHTAEPVISPEQAIAMCDRHFGIGCSIISIGVERNAVSLDK